MARFTKIGWQTCVTPKNTRKMISFAVSCFGLSTNYATCICGRYEVVIMTGFSSLKNRRLHFRGRHFESTATDMVVSVCMENRLQIFPV